MKRKIQCFACGEIIEGDVKLGETAVKTNVAGNEVSTKVPTALDTKNGSPIKCPKCENIIWSIIPTEWENFKNSSITKASSYWDKWTTFFSSLIIQVILFWKLTEISRKHTVYRLYTFLGMIFSIYFIIILFNCTFNEAAIFMLVLYGLIKWR
jgi:hypothetical protein